MKNFNHLHVHSTFSFLDGYGTPDQYLARLEETGQDAMAITDHGNTWSHLPFYFKFKKAGKKLLMGVEAYYIPEFLERDDPAFKDFMRKRYHISIIAKNNTGLKNLYKLVSWSNINGFYYKPMINNEQLIKYQDGLIVMSGCMGSGFPIKNLGDDDKIDQWIQDLSTNINDFYFEVSPLVKVGKPNLTKLVEIGERNEIPIAITSDVHFPNASDYLAEDLMLTIGIKADYNDPNRLKLWDDLYLYDTEEAHRLISQLFGKKGSTYIDNSNKIVESCSAEIQEATPLRFFQDGALREQKARETFKKQIMVGVEKRDVPRTVEYIDRTNREMDLIIQKDFVDYFLIIADLVNWAKKRMLVGVARGSAAGSLVAYLLGITEVDPLKHDLLFERFIDSTRDDLPDIDLDFPHTRRHEVLEYLTTKYGADHVSLLGTLGYFKSKNSIWDIARIYNVPRQETQELANLIEARMKGDERAAFTIEDTIKESDLARKIVDKYPKLQLAAKLEGQIRQSGVHAAAVVIANEPLDHFGSFARYKEDLVLCMDKKSAEDLGLLKIDILGLKHLTVIEDILRMIGKDPEWLYNLPLENPKAFEMMRSGLLQGIFQFEGFSLSKVAAESYPDDFRSMQEVSALGRPGSLHSGGTETYLARRAWEKNFTRSKTEQTTFIHPTLKKITKETYGVIVYQEQVMKIMREVAGFSWDDTSKIRRMISKSMGSESFLKYYDKFKKGCIKTGLTENQVKWLWKQIETMGGYAFNLSHSVSYGIISYWSLFLKAHYPGQFFLATLKEADDDDKIKYLLREWVEHFDGKLWVLHPKSEINFSLQDGAICGGYMNLKGIGLKTAEKIIAAGGVYSGKKATEIIQATLGGSTEFAPWSDLWPIGDEFSEYYEEHNFMKISQVTESTPWIRALGRIKKVDERSMKKVMKNKPYKDEHLDKYINLTIEDDTGQIYVGINRYLYDKMKSKIAKLLSGGIIAVQGKKSAGFMKINIKKSADLQIVN